MAKQTESQPGLQYMTDQYGIPWNVAQQPCGIAVRTYVVRAESSLNAAVLGLVMHVSIPSNPVTFLTLHLLLPSLPSLHGM